MTLEQTLVQSERLMQWAKVVDHSRCQAYISAYRSENDACRVVNSGVMPLTPLARKQSF